MNYLLFLLLQPTLIGGSIEARGAATELARNITAGPVGTFWSGYEVPRVVVQGRTHHGCGGVYRLDDGGGDSKPATDESASTLHMFYRVVDGTVEELQAISSACRIDAGSGSVHWWSGVSVDDSVAFLQQLARDKPRSEIAEQAIYVISQHAGSAADMSLEQFAGIRWPRDLREKAVFWLGSARGETGFRVLSTLIEGEEDPEIREKMVFAFHISDAEGATPKLIALARAHRDPELRAKALFWLAQKAGKQAAAAIAEAVEDDPDLDVKKKAVFALSQLPAEEGVPLLVEVAENHRQREIRKKAFFWLGQSNDPRALSLFEKVLLEKD
ncbi:MAG: HEAT repeat domain-containing protein [Acidobacteria bacterium]|nr:MAG: HEAT repeat domain-containing protein [Acidobacteriota bacterium]